MSYTNTQHPSNTRTTVTIVLSIIFGVSIIPTTALGSPEVQTTPLYFTLENADVLTLYQEVKVKIQKESAVAAEPKGFKTTDTFEATDEVYFIKTDASAAQCVPSPTDVTPRRVTTVGADFAEATVIIKGPEFLVDQSYKMCYKKTSGASSTLYDAVYKPKEGTNPTPLFTVKSSMFTSLVTKPTAVYTGQGPIELSITVTDPKADRTFPSGEQSPRAYLIPCTTADGKCTNKDNIAALCSSSKDSVVTTAVVTLHTTGTRTLKTTFTAPAAKVSTSYMVCVPYCFEAVKCASDLISWALVDSDPITIQAADPVSYTLDPSSPQARTLTKITFTGTGLKNGDKIRIVAQRQQCSSTAALLPDIEYTQLAPTGGPPTATSSVFKFRLKGVLTTAVTGKVCYSRQGATDIWAPVYTTAEPTDEVQKGDLTINPLKPTQFSIVPQSPEIKQVLQIKYTGTGLIAGDSSYLVKCTPEGSVQRQSTTSLDYCDDTTATKHECALTSDASATVNCNVLNYDPAVMNEVIELCACYKKKDHPYYDVVDGSVKIGPRNPVYTISPYPFYVGQGAKLKFTWTDFKDADKVKIIANGGTCDDKALVGVSIADTPVKDGDHRIYTITGSASVCFTVCYLRDSTWTVSTNTRASVGTSTCPSPSSFISPNPTSFRIISPDSPAIGQVLQVQFVGAAGIGLTAQDSSYLVKCTIDGSKPLPSTLCEDTAAPQYVCEIAVNGVNVNCKVLINPAVTTSVGV